MKAKKRKRDAEDRRNLRRRTLRDIQDREWEEESRHMDDDVSEWPDGEEILEEVEDDWLN